MGYYMRGGLRPGSTSNFFIGPGAMYKNFDLSKFNHEDPSTWGELLGATSGGNKINIELEYHVSEIDGAIGAVEGAEWLTKAVASVESTLLEVSVENIKMQLPGFNTTAHNAFYNKIGHNGEIAPTTTHNVAIVGERIGSHVPVIFVLERARATSPFNLDLTDGKDNVKLPITLEARVTEEEPTKVPFYILYPSGGSPVSMPETDVSPGTYTVTQNVMLSAPAGTRIFYTTDGSIPTPGTALEYTGTPIVVDATMTIKAIAVVGAEVSAIASYDYIITTA